ncbi:glycosyltransferase [Pseudorhodoferax sp.]|uniref:glycosyltransferase n=1 Tax=Pseudorhodoferax sp. TaxID=1993553 RepID=UPI002DD67A22|nr:glycosyltransferase [Pseudorhodoferax sp.]
MNAPLPLLAGQWPATSPDHRVRRGVGLAVINFNTAAQTLRCLASLERCEEPPDWILVLDNASRPEDYGQLLAGCRPLMHSTLRLYRSDSNLGFAAGSNFLIEQLLAFPTCRFLGMLNNDAVAQPTMVSRLVDALASAPRRIGLSGGRMHKLHAPEEVDTLGICIYASLMPADRHSTDDPFLGPTGGCCMLARELVEELLATSGYCFDPRYFCYCEDTDLVLRANLLGYEPSYVDEVVALHEGQASSGGGFNRFIAYHGIRNSIWMQLKLMPSAMLARHGALLLLAHLVNMGRYVLAGHGRLLLDVYRDAWNQRQAFLQERPRWVRSGLPGVPTLSARLAPGFYRAGYWRLAWKQLVRHRRAPK